MNGFLLIAGILFGGIIVLAATYPVSAEEQSFTIAEEVPLLGSDTAQRGAHTEVWSGLPGNRVLSGVTMPTITAFLPKGDGAPRPAVVIAPGGGFIGLTMEGEAYPTAHWLASNGVVAIVLKHRLVPLLPLDARPGNSEGLFKQAMSDAAKDAGGAVAMARYMSAEWNIDPERVGFLGFSSGAIAGLTATTLLEEAVGRPDFLAMVYGPLAAPKAALRSDLPPLWAALSSDDPLFGASDLGLVPAWRATGSPVELHYYERGGHGWGYPGANGTTSAQWADHLLFWMRVNGFAEEAKPSTRLFDARIAGNWLASRLR